MTQVSSDIFLRYYLNEHPQLPEYLGEQLYQKIITSVISERTQGFNIPTQEDCITYIHNLIFNQISDSHFRQKSVINNGLAKLFPEVHFEEVYAALGIAEAEITDDIVYLGDVDYLGYVGEKAFGIQIKPTTAKANFGNYSVSERMRNSFAAFSEEFSGKVFIIFSLDGEVGNPEILPQIADEIDRLQA